MKLKLAIAGAVLALGLASPALADSPRDGRDYDRSGDYNDRWNNDGDHGRWNDDDDRRRGDFHHSREWQLVGSAEVAFRPENDTFYLRGHRRYREVMVCAYRAPVRVFDLDVRYRHGRTQDLNVRDTLRPNSCTRAIDLRGFSRDVEAVSIDYRTERFGRVGWDDRRWGGRFGPTALVRVYAR